MTLFQYITEKLGIKNTKNKASCFAENYWSEFRNILNSLEILLTEGKHFAQSNFVKLLIEITFEKNYEKFITEINSVNIWGGSGAVWEVSFENQIFETKFHKQIISLINLMEKTKILGSGIKPLRTALQKSSNNKN